ncbi:MAG: hypothetical protein Q8N99_00100 [Nanoarchaeota archaeon]|nr:hypothetical protein [Nanoarchaeota archaeon]
MECGLSVQNSEDSDDKNRTQMDDLLSVLLGDFWDHYIFVLISLIRSKIGADRKETKDEFRT